MSDLLNKPLRGLMTFAPPDLYDVEMITRVESDPVTGECSIIESWGGGRRVLAEGYRKLRKPVRPFMSCGPCPHCEAWAFHWMPAVHDGMVVRECRDCHLAWGEAQ